MMQLSGSYEDRAKQLAATMEEKDAVYCDCSCYDLPLENQRVAPEDRTDFKTFNAAIETFCLNKLLGKLYWSVHVQGRHLLHVHHAIFGHNGNLSCPKCRGYVTR